MKTTSSLRRSLLLAAGSSLLAASSAYAQDTNGTWLGNGSAWNVAGAWSGGTIADGVGYTANFTGVDVAGAVSMSLGANRTIGNIIFTDDTTSSHNLTLTGNTLTLDVTSGAPLVDVTQSDRTLTIDSIIAGNEGLTKTGLGILAISGANTYTGATVVNQGTLNVLDATNGIKSSSSLSIAAGATVNATGLNSLMIGGWTIAGTLNKTDNTGQDFYTNAVTLNNGTISGTATGGTAANFGNYFWAGATITANGSSNIINATRLGFSGGNIVNTPLVTDALSISSIIGAPGTNAASGTLTKNGLGTLTLSGANTYTGLTTVNAGELRWGVNNALGAGNLTVNSGGTVNMNGFTDTVGTITLNRGAINLSGTVSLKTGSGGFITTGGTVNNWPGIGLGGDFAYNTAGGSETTAFIGGVDFNGGSRTFTIADGVQEIDVNISVSLYDAAAGNRNFIKAGPGTLRISGSSFANYNLGSGVTTIQDGVLLLNKSGNNAVGGTGLVTVGDGTGAANSAVLRYVGGNDQIVSNAITVNSDGLLDLADKTDTVGAVTLAGGSITGTTGVLTGSSYAFQGGSASAILGGNVALTKSTAGTVTLSGANTYTGNTTVSSGRLEVTSTGKLYNAAYINGPVVTVAAGATLRLNGWQYDGAGSLGKLDFGVNRLVLNGGTIEYTGSSNYDPLNEGTASRNFTVGTGGATLRASSPAGQTWTISIGNGDITNNTGLTLDGAGGGAIRKVIAGSGSVTKSGAGTWTLSGGNTYIGVTTVTGGTLLINGTHTGGGLITVSAGATLGGNGLVGMLTVADDGILSPGNSAGHLTVGDLTLNPASVLAYELGAPTLAQDPGSDFITLTSSLILDGVLNITPIAGFGTPVAGDKWLIMTSAGGITDNGLNIGAAPALGSGLSFAVDASSQADVYLVVVPEAGTAALLGLGLLGLLLRRRGT